MFVCLFATLTSVRTIVLNSFTFLCFVAVSVFVGLLFDLCFTMISYGLLSWFFWEWSRVFGCSRVFYQHTWHTDGKKSNSNNSTRESREFVRLFVVPITWSFQMYRFFVTDGSIWKLHVVHTCAEGKKCPKIMMHVPSCCCCYSAGLVFLVCLWISYAQEPGTANLRWNNLERHRKPLY